MPARGQALADVVARQTWLHRVARDVIGAFAAYALARAHYREGSINRVVLATDGDFNVGVSSDDELVKLITEKAKSGVFLSVLGFGEGNLNGRQVDAPELARPALQAIGVSSSTSRPVRPWPVAAGTCFAARTPARSASIRGPISGPQ